MIRGGHGNKKQNTKQKHKNTKHEKNETMEKENIERGEAAAKQNPNGEGLGGAAAKQNPQGEEMRQNPEGDGAKKATGGKGIIMCVNADIGKVYDNANLQRLYLAMMEGLIRNILPVIVGECRKVADGLDNATREGARDAIAKEGGEA